MIAGPPGTQASRQRFTKVGPSKSDSGSTKRLFGPKMGAVGDPLRRIDGRTYAMGAATQVRSEQRLGSDPFLELQERLSAPMKGFLVSALPTPSVRLTRVRDLSGAIDGTTRVLRSPPIGFGVHTGGRGHCQILSVDTAKICPREGGAQTRNTRCFQGLSLVASASDIFVDIFR